MNAVSRQIQQASKKNTVTETCSELTLRCLRDRVRPLQRGHGLFPDRDRPPGTLDSCGDRGDDVPTVPGPPCTPDGRGKSRLMVKVYMGKPIQSSSVGRCSDKGGANGACVKITRSAQKAPSLFLRARSRNIWGHQLLKPHKG